MRKHTIPGPELPRKWYYRTTRRKSKKNKFAKALWKGTDILVVDEISMLSLKLFVALNAIGKSVRGNFKPFGGIQLVFTGDFYHLPPNISISSPFV